MTHLDKFIEHYEAEMKSASVHNLKTLERNYGILLAHLKELRELRKIVGIDKHLISL